jgi:3-oxoacyl-[acyl-carrier protein] reductase
MPFHASIASAKGAVEGLTRSLAAELAPKIRVNAIAPSLTDTPLASALLSDEGRRSAAADRHPLKRFGTAGDIAAAATFLLEDASAWITGQVIAVDGGMGSVRTFK